MMRPHGNHSWRNYWNLTPNMPSLLYRSSSVQSPHFCKIIKGSTARCIYYSGKGTELIPVVRAGSWHVPSSLFIAQFAGRIVPHCAHWCGQWFCGNKFTLKALKESVFLFPNGPESPLTLKQWKRFSLPGVTAKELVFCMQRSVPSRGWTFSGQFEGDRVRLLVASSYFRMVVCLS